jgi:hypothetical protein
VVIFVGAPEKWNLYLGIHYQELETVEFEQSKFDPCLFVGTKLICVVYIDDLIFSSKDTQAINDSSPNHWSRMFMES